MSRLDGLISENNAPDGLDARDFSRLSDSGLDAVLSSIGAVFPEPLFIVDEGDALVWMNLAMADRICRDNALEPDYAVEWLLSQVDDQAEDVLLDGKLGQSDPGAMRVVALLDVLGRAEWLTVRICDLPCDGKSYRMVVLQDITPIKRDALALREENATLNHRLRHDLSTGLASRCALTDALAVARPKPEKALILVEIVGFRQQAARHGRLAVERVLERMAADIADMVEDDTLVARVAEDRFAILSAAEAAPADLAHRAETMLDVIGATHRFPTGLWRLALRAACSAGPSTGADHVDLLHVAETVLAEAADQPGEDRVHIVAEHGARRTKRHRDEALQAGLEAAIAGQQLEAFLQPAIRTQDGGVAFVEAMVRWRHPDSGLIPPPFFLSIAQSAGLIEAVDLATARSACAVAERWQSTGVSLPLALNLSHDSIRSAQTRAALLELFEEVSFNPGALIFECGRVPRDRASDPALLEGIAALRATGMRFALEDAGAQHTDPAELFLLRPDIVKLGPASVARLQATLPDTGAVEDPQVLALQAYLHTAATLGCELVGVGVQDRAQPAALHRAGVHLLQGHLIGRPMAGSKLQVWLDGCERAKDGGLRARVSLKLPAQP